MPRRAQGGFTLVEMLITLLVVVILLTAGAPAFNDTIMNNRLVVGANSLAGMLASARAEAIARRATVTVCGSSAGTTCDAAWSSGAIFFVDNDADGALDADETVLKHSAASPGAVGVGLSGATTVRYGSQGFATTGANSSFVLCDKRGAAYGKALTVSSTGRASVATDTDTIPDGIVDDAAGNNIVCP